MEKALIIVDYQYDFVATDGKLTAGAAAQDIEGRLVELVEGFNKDGDYSGVFFTYDCHYITDFTENKHPEGSVFGPHCISKEKGFHYYGRLREYEKSPGNGVLHLSKRGYCLNGEDIGGLINKYDEITFAGVVTDICVFQNVIAFYNAACNMDKQIVLNVDKRGCASFDEKRQEFSLKYLKEVLGVNIIL